MHICESIDSVKDCVQGKKSWTCNQHENRIYPNLKEYEIFSLPCNKKWEQV